MRSAASKRQQAAYEKEQTRHFSLKLNRSTDGDIILWLEGQENTQGYLKRLIRRDMGSAEQNALLTIAARDERLDTVEAMEEAGATEEEI